MGLALERTLPAARSGGSASLISAGVCSLSLAAGFRFGLSAPSVASPRWNSLRSGPPGTRSHHSRFGKLLLGLRISCAFFSDIYYRMYVS